MTTKLYKTCLALAATATVTIYGCGGGGGGGLGSAGGGDNNATPTSTFLGTAAVGAPIVDGTVTIIDSRGAVVGVTTTRTDGSYTLNFEPTKFTAPFVLTVTGNLGEASITLVSVQANQPANSSRNTVNITPITNAIAARLSSTGNPTDLAANIVNEKANITSATVTTTEQAFREILTSNMSAVGLASTTNLISGTFNAQLDKLLDNIQVQVTTAGDIQMTSSAGTAVDDLAPTTTSPVNVKVANLTRNTILSTDVVNSLKNNLPATAKPVGVDVMTAVVNALDTCFAVLPASARATAPACKSLVGTGYLHDGRNSSAEFDGVRNDSGNDNMQFRTPEILRHLDTTSNAEKMVVRLTAVRADGQFRGITTVARNTNTGWELYGNQREFETFAIGVAAKRISANTPANNRYETGLNLFVGNHESIASVVVTGPGLPVAGVTLKPKAGCEFLAIADGSGSTPLCAGFYRLRSLKIDGTQFKPADSTHLFGPTVNDESIQAIKPLDLYQYVITKKNASSLTYWNRLRSRPMTVAEVGLVKFVDFTPATAALMTTATLYVGGPAPTLSWTVPAHGPRPFKAIFIHARGRDFKDVPFSASSATISCNNNDDCAGNNYQIPLNTTESHLFQTTARNRFDSLIFTQISK